MRTHFVIATVPTLSLRAQRGNLVAVATAVRRRVFTLIEIATSLSSSQWQINAGTRKNQPLSKFTDCPPNNRPR